MPDDGGATGRSVLMVNPSSDVYGADLQLLESATALRLRGWEVDVVTPMSGPLGPRLAAAGVGSLQLDFPVLRRSNLGAKELALLVRSVLGGLPRMVRCLRQRRPDVLYVNTVTIPWWLLAARLAGVRVLCHVHEAETQNSRVVQAALMLPLRLAHRTIVISDSAMNAMTDAVPRLRRRAVLVRNGVPRPPGPVQEATVRVPHRLVTVGRLSPRKGTDVALAAVALLVARGHDVTLDVVGSTFSGYEWFESDLRSRAEQDDLRGRVRFTGYLSPVWDALASAEVVLMPSLREPFGNAVVEAQLSQRPVVAADALGHRESIEHGVSGLLVPPGDASAMADAVENVLTDPELARDLGRQGRQSAETRFSVERYGDEVERAVGGLARRGAAT